MIVFSIIIVGLCAIFAGLARKHRNEAGQFCRQAHEWASAALMALETARASNKATEKFVGDTLISMKVLLDRTETAAADASRRAQSAKDSGDLTYKYLLDTEKLRKDAHGAADHATRMADSVKKYEKIVFDHAVTASDSATESQKSVVLSQNHALDAAKSAQVSEKSSTESREHMLATHELVSQADNYYKKASVAASAAECSALEAARGSGNADCSASKAQNYAETAAEHVAVASRVSVMVRDLASQAGVKLVPAGKIYGTDGSNIHRG